MLLTCCDVGSLGFLLTAHGTPIRKIGKSGGDYSVTSEANTKSSICHGCRSGRYGGTVSWSELMEGARRWSCFVSCLVTCCGGCGSTRVAPSARCPRPHGSRLDIFPR